MQQIRQGDVMLVRCEIPTDAKPVKTFGRVVIAEGEATGHAHTLDTEVCDLYERDGVLYVAAKSADELKHQEHAAIPVPAGTYRVVRQREWSDAEEPRQVAD